MFDAYAVAIRLHLKDEFSGAMGLLSNHLIKANLHARELQKKLDGIGKLFKAGAMTTAAGFGMAMVLKESTNEAVRYEQQLNKLKALNLDMRFGAGTTGNLEAQAQNIVQTTKGTTSVEALRLLTETQAITGDLKHTAELAPLLAKMRFGMEAYMSANGKGERHGSKIEAQFGAVVKAMEMRGLMRNFTSEKMEAMADLFVKNYAASGGQVKPTDFLAMMKTGGVAGKTVGDDFMFALGHIMQESGGNRSGTQLMSMYQNMVAGRMPQQVAESLNKLGLLDSKHIHYGTTGHITKVDPGGMKQSELLMSRPDLYMSQVILPALKAHGVDTGNQQAVLKSLNTMAGQRTASNLLAQLFLEQSQIANYIEQAKHAKGVQGMYDQSGKSTVGQQNDLMAKVNQLELNFGKASLPLLKSLLEQAIPLVKSLGDWMDKHPDGLATMAKGFALLAAAMMISGPLMILGSGIKLLSLAATLVSPALGKFAIAMAFNNVGGAVGLASIAGSLGTVGGQLKMLGVAGAAFAAYQLGDAAGSYIYDHMGDEQKTNGGRNIARILALFGNKEAQDALDQEKKTGRGFVKTGSDRPIQVSTTTNIDGRKVAETVSHHQAKAASAPQSAQASFDGSMHLRPAGANGGW